MSCASSVEYRRYSVSKKQPKLNPSIYAFPRAPQPSPSRNRRFPAQHPLSKIKLWSTQGQSKAIGVHSSVKCTPNGRYIRLSNVFQICDAFVSQMHFNPRSLFTVQSPVWLGSADDRDSVKRRFKKMQCIRLSNALQVALTLHSPVTSMVRQCRRSRQRETHIQG